MDDINLAAELDQGDLLLPGTEGSYATYLRKFAAFMKFDVDQSAEIDLRELPLACVVLSGNHSV